MDRLLKHSEEVLRLIREAEGDLGMPPEDENQDMAAGLGGDTMGAADDTMGMGNEQMPQSTPPIEQPAPVAEPTAPPAQEIDITELVDAQDEQKDDLEGIRSMLKNYKAEFDNLGTRVNNLINTLSTDLKSELIKRLPTPEEKDIMRRRIDATKPETPEEFYARKQKEQDNIYKELADTTKRYNVAIKNYKSPLYTIDSNTVDELMANKNLNPFKY